MHTPNKRAAILHRRTKLPLKWCEEFLSDVGLFSVTLSRFFCRSVHRMDTQIALAAIRAAKHDQQVEALEQAISDEALNDMLDDVRVDTASEVQQSPDPGTLTKEELDEMFG